MRMKTLGALSAALLTFSLACARGGDKDAPLEGDDAGECTDQADNDVNGLFDCDDPGCAGSPACDGVSTDDSDDGPQDTGFRGRVVIDDLDVDCDSGSWWFDVDASGVVGQAELYLAVSSFGTVYTEYAHTFPATTRYSGSGDTRGTHGPNGFWSNPYLELDIARNPDAVRLGQTTAVPCDEGASAFVTWSLVVTEDGAQADCVSWGNNPTGEIEGYDFGGCDTI